MKKKKKKIFIGIHFGEDFLAVERAEGDDYDEVFEEIERNDAELVLLEIEDAQKLVEALKDVLSPDGTDWRVVIGES